LEHELDKVMRSRLLNPRWIEGMQQHGYKGAFEMGASLDYLFAYDAATDRVPDWCYGALCDQWLNTPEIVEFLEAQPLGASRYGRAVARSFKSWTLGRSSPEQFTVERPRFQ
jgi:cobalamin biosynthesis Mg chelatase CobN